MPLSKDCRAWAEAQNNHLKTRGCFRGKLRHLGIFLGLVSLVCHFNVSRFSLWVMKIKSHFEGPFQSWLPKTLLAPRMWLNPTRPKIPSPRVNQHIPGRRREFSHSHSPSFGFALPPPLFWPSPAAPQPAVFPAVPLVWPQRHFKVTDHSLPALSTDSALKRELPQREHVQSRAGVYSVTVDHSLLWFSTFHLRKASAVVFAQSSLSKPSYSILT